MITHSTPACPGIRRPKAVVSGLPSDSHTWNLVFIQLFLEERGHEVINLGPCVTDEILISQCVSIAPELVVMSTVNGHGRADGTRIIRKLRHRAELAGLPVVIGGKLGLRGVQRAADMQALLDSGYDGVFDDSAQTASFEAFLDGLTVKRGALC